MADIATTKKRFFAGLAVTWLAVGLFLFIVAPRGDAGLEWTESLSPGGWMAWTLPTAIFFWVIAGLLITMTILAIQFPETPRIGLLRIETTRGDRLFISLLGSAFICLIWLGVLGPPLWWALATCLVYAAIVFALV